jgi:hypothetical protein
MKLGPLGGNLREPGISKEQELSFGCRVAMTLSELVLELAFSVILFPMFAATVGAATTFLFFPAKSTSVGEKVIS